MSMLKVDNLSVHYGMIQAVRDVSFEVNEGEVVSLIGANGAGKTTILRTLSGLVRPSSGKIEFLGQEIQKMPAQKIVAGGLSQVPEGRHVFPGLTVMENLEMGAFLKKNREENQANLKKVFSRFQMCIRDSSWSCQLTIITTRVSNNLPSHRNSPSLSVIH